MELLPVIPDYEDYLRDESRLAGRAETISFPRNEEEIREVLSRCAAEGLPVTVQGGRTGITGGAVPRGGHILNLSRMDRILGLRSQGESRWLAAVQPGVPLSALNDTLAAAAPPLFLPPDPTETTATLGGMTATNASGARSFRYGPTRAYVEALRLVLADGSALALSRGVPRAQGRRFQVTSDYGRVLHGELPCYRAPAIKNAAGLFIRPDMELIDLVIGSEGTLGVITEIQLRLLPLPPNIWAVLAFFNDEAGALEFVRTARDSDPRPVALEYFDENSLRLLERSAPAAVYVEYHSERDTSEEELAAVGETLERCGGEESRTWSADTPQELARLKEFRHSLPETVNRIIAERQKQIPRITKLGTDMAVPNEALERSLAMYHRDLEAEGLEHVLFGHIGDSHIHVNILPRTLTEYERGQALTGHWAEAVIGWGGTVSAEHGIGKLKVELLRRMYGSDTIAEMRRLIEVFNPGRRLNPGNMVR